MRACKPMLSLISSIDICRASADSHLHDLARRMEVGKKCNYLLNPTKLRSIETQNIFLQSKFHKQGEAIRPGYFCFISVAISFHSDPFIIHLLAAFLLASSLSGCCVLLRQHGTTTRLPTQAVQ